MRNNARTSADDPRAVRHWSLTRRTWYDADLPTEVVSALRSGDVDEVLFGSVPLQVKDRCIVGRYVNGADTLLVKRHTWGGLSRTLRMAFREPAARSCARFGRYLYDLGVRTPRPRGTVDLHFGPWSYRSYLISDFVEGDTLYHCMRFGTQSDEELRYLAKQVAQIWQQFVTLGVSHNDFKPENFIVDDKLRVWVIDLEKMRIGGNADRRRKQQIFDVKNFLHVRNWHQRAEARAVFAEAFLNSPSRGWLATTGIERVANGLGLDESERETDLTALILCSGGIDMRVARQAIESVRDIADEAVLVELTERGGFAVLQRIDLCKRSTAARVARQPFATSNLAQVAKCPWVLMLGQNEIVTPFLAKELQQRIADGSGPAALRIVVEPHYFGRGIARPKGEPPIRAFRQEECSLAIGEGGMCVLADVPAIGNVCGTIQANECATVGDLIDRLNDSTSRAAMNRLRAGEHPRMAHAAVRAVCEFSSTCVNSSGLRSGWTGLQIAAIQAAFTVFEEAKLYQFANEFRRAGGVSGMVADDVAATARPNDDSVIRRSRAA